MKKIHSFFIVLLLITGCQTNKNIVYLQDSGKNIQYNDSTSAQIPDVTLKVGDLLTITVNSETEEAAVPFNLPLIPNQSNFTSYNQGNASSMGGGGSLQNYLVDTNGEITFPILGKIKADGMTKTALIDYLKQHIYPRYIKDEPIITIRYANFKISVIGEVNTPGISNIQNEKISVLEAIAMAGDLTIYGRRDNVLLIRENNGKRESVRIDLRDKRLLNSPYYYLQQNDILYIQPNDPKSRSSALSTAETVSISIIGTLISLTSLLVNLLR